MMTTMNKQDKLNSMITIDPTYYSIKCKIPVNDLLRSYKFVSDDYLKMNEGKQIYPQLICSHLFYIKTSNELEYMKANYDYTQELFKKYNPHLHIMATIPPDEQMDYFFFVKKKMKMIYPYSMCDFRQIGQSDDEQIKVIYYGMKENTTIYNHNDLTNGVIF